ncbi:MAG TPA: hypothetical protein VN316_02590 [candidate division Zixibacteria bacterium]|nr:hypothetical protein [candidate division Zixibacteria bacterium]
MNHISVYVIILSGLLAAGIALVAADYQLSEPGFEATDKSYIPVEAAGFEILTANASVIPLEAPVELSYPKPGQMPAQRSYQINKNHDIWHAEEPASYITPQNEWVKYYASLLYINYDGRIRYKYIKVPWLTDKDGNVISWINRPFLNNYVSDDVQFDHPPNSDMWVMPDYYLTNGMSDDCDGWAVTVASMLQSGELSVLQNQTFIKKIIPAKVVLGYVGGYRDAWVEYKAYDKDFFTSTSLVNSGLDGKEKISSTEFTERKNKASAIPVFEFTDKHFGEYNDINR